MESIISILKKIKSQILRYWRIPKILWFNKNISNNTFIDKRYLYIQGSENIIIGENTKILAGLRIEAINSYCNIKYSPSIKIGKSVCINQNFHCTCASSIEIGDGTSITANCGIFDIIHPYENINVNPRHQTIITESIKIGKNCLIGMNSVIHPGVTMGDHVIVGSNSTVTAGLYPSYCVLAGSPAKIIKQYNFTTKHWDRI